MHASSWSLRCGILSLLGLPVAVPLASHANPVAFLVGLMGMIGIVFGVVALSRRTGRRGQAITGLVFSTMALAACLALSSHVD